MALAGFATATACRPSTPAPHALHILSRRCQAERLRRELQAAQGIEPDGAAAGRGAGRVDSADLRRETLFTAPSSPRNWLSENDVEFFSTEDSGDGAGNAEAAAVVQRRLLLGLAAVAGLGAFALVPTEDLSLSRPSKPLRAYLLPLLRAAALLDEAQGSVERGDGDELRAIVGSVLGFNALQNNLRSAAACERAAAAAAAAAASLARRRFSWRVVSARRRGAAQRSG